MLSMGLLVLGLMQSTSLEDTQIVPPHRWTVDYGRLSCTLARRIGEADSPILAINQPLGQDPGEIVVMDGGTGLDARLTGELELRLDDAAPIIVRARREQRNGLLVVNLTPVPEDFIDRFAPSERLAVAKEGAVVLAAQLEQTRAGVDALERCNEDLLQSWGVDVAGRNALSRKPRPMSLYWAPNIMPRENAALAFVVDVAENGRPLDCRVVISSGNERMDRAFCNLVRSRARFHPGLDSSARPVRAQYVSRIRWRIED